MFEEEFTVPFRSYFCNRCGLEYFDSVECFAYKGISDMVIKEGLEFGMLIKRKVSIILVDDIVDCRSQLWAF